MKNVDATMSRTMSLEEVIDDRHPARTEVIHRALRFATSF